MALVNYASMGPAVSRSDSLGHFNMYCMDNHSYLMMEKRQLFLRSYQFSRKKTLSERIKTSFVKVKRVVLFRLRKARKLRKLVWSKLSRLRQGFYSRRRSRFLRLLCNNYYYSNNNSSSCFR